MTNQNASLTSWTNTPDLKFNGLQAGSHFFCLQAHFTCRLSGSLRLPRLAVSPLAPCTQREPGLLAGYTSNGRATAFCQKHGHITNKDDFLINHIFIQPDELRKRWADDFQVYQNAIHFNLLQFCLSMLLVDFLCLHPLSGLRAQLSFYIHLSRCCLK